MIVIVGLSEGLPFELDVVVTGAVQVLVCSTEFVTTPSTSVSVVRQRNVAVGLDEDTEQRKLKVNGDGTLLV
jgi:hypothetical protein